MTLNHCRALHVVQTCGSALVVMLSCDTEAECNVITADTLLAMV